MESVYFNERGKYRKFSLSHRLKLLEKKFKKDGGKFKEYKIHSDVLFNVEGTKSLDEGKLSFVPDGINFVGRVNENNGIKGKIRKRTFSPNEENTITATVIGNYKYVKFQEEEYYCSQNINKLVPNFKINKFIAMYLIPHIQRFVSKYDGQQGGYKLNELKEHIIILPTKNNQIDFTYMENYIHVLETERVHVLENYLHVSGLDSYSLTSEEATVLNNLRSGNVVFKQYKIGNLFDIEGIRQAKSQSAIPNDDKGIPYVVQSQFNNMVSRFVNEKYLCNNNEPVCEGNAIVLGVTLAAVSYQDRKFGASQVITARAKFLNENIGNYFVALLRKLMVQFSYQNKPGIKIYKEMMVSLPTNENNQPDFAFMETYIRAIEKKVIKNVVDWKDKEIEKTKDVVSSIS